jgi:hypothetical protein
VGSEFNNELGWFEGWVPTELDWELSGPDGWELCVEPDE